VSRRTPTHADNHAVAPSLRRASEKPRPNTPEAEPKSSGVFAVSREASPNPALPHSRAPLERTSLQYALRAPVRWELEAPRPRRTRSFGALESLH
jgi:hypothetical protein